MRETYTNGIPMSDEDKLAYKWLTYIGVGSLAIIFMVVELLVILYILGK